MEFLQQHLFEEGLLSLREVMRLLLLSGLFTVACLMAFPSNAPSRRVLLIVGVMALTVLPWALGGMNVIWYVATDHLPALTLSAQVPNILLWTWVAVGLGLVTQHLLKVGREVRWLAKLPLITDDRAGLELSRLAQVMHIPVPTLRQGDCACSTTLRAPMVVLPATWREWDDTMLRSVLAHELTHIQRRDDRWLLLTRTLVLSYWWMPWLIWMYRVYVRAMEESCDDAASEQVGHHLGYVSALVGAAAEQRSNAYSNVANMSEHHLVGRVGRFADKRVLELDTSGVYWSVIVILVLVVALTGVEPVVEPVRAVVSVGERAEYLQVVPEHQLAIYPRVLETTDLPNHISSALGDRLRYPDYAPSAVYPGAAIRDRVEGAVIVEFSVSADGTVSNPVILASRPADIFAESALRAVRNTRYSPAHSVPLYATPAQTIRKVNRSLHSDPKPPTALQRMRRTFRFRLESR